ncbi:YhcN/YlaJ family sporulation lipoprotein [Pseudalkalibacillus decolorationis]|uniref:YhcN/YlaJ family sporulation lipoprotein n=1 Tax=Pseudalkalibacillus decolorationis TaxID=163879 RepID=UPI002147D1C4|nr:YhcN/YlaJ family sporulation lipoprotein [Pseudalkalibacillus decolorationis]
MKKTIVTLMVTIMLTVIVLVSACDNKNDSNEQKGMETKITHTNDPTILKSIDDLKGVEDIRMVRSRNKLLVAIKITNFDRFQLEEITGKVKKKLKKQHPDKEVTVSSDKKIFLELDRLDNRIKSEQLGEDQINKEVEKLIKLSKDEG